MRTLDGQNVPNIAKSQYFPHGTGLDDNPVGSGTGTPITEKAGWVDVYNGILAIIKHSGLDPSEMSELQVFEWATDKGHYQIYNALKRLFARRDKRTLYCKITVDDVPIGNKISYASVHLLDDDVTAFFNLTGVGQYWINFVMPHTGNIGLCYVNDDGEPMTYQELGFAAQDRSFGDSIHPAIIGAGTSNPTSTVTSCFIRPSRGEYGFFEFWEIRAGAFKRYNALKDYNVNIYMPLTSHYRAGGDTL